MRLPRLTTRRIMAVVAAVAFICFGGLMIRNRTERLARAHRYAQQESVLSRSLAVYEGDLALSHAELRRAQDEVEWRQGLLARGRKWNDSPALMNRSLVARRMDVERCRFRVEEAEARVAAARNEKDSVSREKRRYARAARRPWLAVPTEPR